jgi:hypothetical protein
MASNIIARRSLRVFAVVRHRRRRIVRWKRNINELLRDGAMAGRKYDGTQDGQDQNRLPARARLEGIHGREQRKREGAKIPDGGNDNLLITKLFRLDVADPL